MIHGYKKFYEVLYVSTDQTLDHSPNITISVLALLNITLVLDIYIYFTGIELVNVGPVKHRSMDLSDSKFKE